MENSEQRLEHQIQAEIKFQQDANLLNPGRSMIKTCNICGGLYTINQFETFAGTPCLCGINHSLEENVNEVLRQNGYDYDECKNVLHMLRTKKVSKI